MSIQILGSSVFLLLSCKRVLYIWGINPLSDKLFAAIFSCLVSGLLILLMVSFAVPKTYSLIESHLFFLYFYFLGEWYMKTLVGYMSENVLPMFSSRSFTVSCFILKCWSYFEFIFLHGERVCSNFIDLHKAVQLSQHHLLKRLFFSCYIFL